MMQDEFPASPDLGLVRYARSAWARGRPPRGRDIVGRLFPPKKGECRWCGRPTHPTVTWHTECVDACSRARGLTRMIGFHRGPCERCGASGDELDHRLSIAVAKELGYRFHVRSYLPANLRWLCRPCHLAKTRDDRRRLANLKITRRLLEALEALPGPLLLPAPPAPPAHGQLDLFG